MRNGGLMSNYRTFKNSEEAFQYIIEGKKKCRKKFSKLAMEKKIKIIEELKQTSQWLRNNAKIMKRGL